MTNDLRPLSADMTAIVHADLQGAVPSGLIADMLRAVLDENRLTKQQWAPEQLMLEVHRRLERLLRARSPGPERHARGNHRVGLVS
jgi:hypothetical protein